MSEASGIDPRIAEEAAKDSSNSALLNQLDVLKHSNLRFSLIADIIGFARSDGKYTLDEEDRINRVCDYLGITEEQSNVLSHVVEKSNALVTAPDEATDEGFFEKNGFMEMLSNARIPIDSIVKGLLGLATPFILSKMVNRRAQSGSPAAGGLGGGLGGTLLGAFQGGRIGGLGSILGNLSGGRKYSSLGSVLKRTIEQKM